VGDLGVPGTMGHCERDGKSCRIKNALLRMNNVIFASFINTRNYESCMCLREKKQWFGGRPGGGLPLPLNLPLLINFVTHAISPACITKYSASERGIL